MMLPAIVTVKGIQKIIRTVSILSKRNDALSRGKATEGSCYSHHYDAIFRKNYM